MRSSSADAPRGGRGRRGTWALLGALLAGALLLGPAVGYAAAQFGSTSTVTFTITVRSASTGPDAPADPGDPADPTDPAADPAPAPAGPAAP
ncbi:hypothetical protein CHO01_10480 [Cellulomonas hominis]|uniref:Uncharacterized protein n=1 Tax=Cellulomonas hominis TaxID=156981 RepID=A0A511F9M2_9CELL|nr:hypothetical protein [Cellulomonas hominis]MBB5473603.1 hypothetical protein [Cellulomonas hominis]GEL45932.1 hypothetical protein CHO01_10480 [Cellulomonas hominis]